MLLRHINFPIRIMDLGLKDKKILVTASSRGIGVSIAGAIVPIYGGRITW